MIENNQGQKDEWSWEREHVQRVLDYHNNKYNTNIVIKEKTQKVYPELKGKSDWDWVCYDSKTNDEIAVEVKQFTDRKLEVKQNVITDILEEIKGDLLNRLPGIFILGITIPKDYYLPLRGNTNKQKFKNVLCETIFQTAQTLKSKEERNLTPQIIEQLPFTLPSDFFCALQKFEEDGSALYKSSGIISSWSTKLNLYELNHFEDMVSHANDQLKLATNAKQTILIIIEEGLRITTHGTMAMAFEQFNHDSYSQINQIYCLSGKEVEEFLSQ